MAKIYETKEDFQRDVLKDQANHLHLKAEKQVNAGLLASCFGFIADNFNRAKEIPSRGLAWAGSLLQIFGLVKIVNSFFTGSKAHDLELKRNLLGPEKAIHVINAPSVAENADCCKKPKYLQGIEPKTLLEKAINSDSARQL